MGTIERAYATLKQLGLTKSQYDFSRDWLGRCESYMSANKARGTEPSVQSLLFLDLRLQSMRNAFGSASTRVMLKMELDNWANCERLFG